MNCRGVVSMFWSSSTFCSKIHINSPTYTAFQRTDMTSTCHCHEAPDVKIKESIITFLRVVVLPYTTTINTNWLLNLKQMKNDMEVWNFPTQFFYHTGCTGSLKIHKWITQKKVDALCKKFCVIAPACFLNE